MAFPQGCNFRATSGHTTDGADEDFIGASTTYPYTTAQGNNVGWVTGFLPSDSRDRDNTNDRRITGHNSVSSGTARFRIDLPSTGNYDVELGSYENTGANSSVAIYDDTSLVSTLTSDVAINNDAADATGTVYSLANWPSSQTAVNLSFSTTTFIAYVTHGGTGFWGIISHLKLTFTGSPSVSVPIFRNHYIQQGSA